MKQNLSILLVDDDPVLIELHSAFLENNNYSVIAAIDGLQALQILESNFDNVGVIVADINMPNMDGYELCARVKGNDNTSKIPIIFVSSLTSLEEKLKGYSVGADDYVPKPVSEEELIKKINVLLNIRSHTKLLDKEVEDSRNMAMHAMSYSSELGQVIEFYRSVMNANDYVEVSKQCFDLMAAFNLVCVIHINAPYENINMSPSGVVSPLEANVIELARDKGRYFDFGTRTIVNYSAFSLLIKNMPIDDQEKYGRLKDMLGMIGNGLDARIHLLNEEVVEDKKDQFISCIKDSINIINKSFADLQKENVTAIEDMNEQINNAIMVLGLTEEQEYNIQHITESCLLRTNKAFYKGVSIENNLEQIYRQFHALLGIKYQGQPESVCS